MRRLQSIALAVFTVAVLLVPSSALAARRATCTGSAACRACKNCRYCKHCAKNGGTCGVCRRQKEASWQGAKERAEAKHHHRM
jgi:hypothetical protein